MMPSSKMSILPMPLAPPVMFNCSIIWSSGNNDPFRATGRPFCQLSVMVVGLAEALAGGVNHIQIESGSSVVRSIPPLAIERHHIVLSSPPAITSSTGTP